MYCKVKTEGRTVFVHTNPLETIGAIKATYCGLVDEAVASVKLHDAAGTLLKDEDTVQALGYDTGFVLRASD